MLTVKKVNKRKKQAKLLRQLASHFYSLDQCCEVLVPNNEIVQGKLRDSFRFIRRDLDELSRTLYPGGRHHWK